VRACVRGCNVVCGEGEREREREREKECVRVCVCVVIIVVRILSQLYTWYESIGAKQGNEFNHIWNPISQKIEVSYNVNAFVYMVHHNLSRLQNGMGFVHDDGAQTKICSLCVNCLASMSMWLRADR